MPRPLVNAALIIVAVLLVGACSTARSQPASQDVHAEPSACAGSLAEGSEGLPAWASLPAPGLKAAVADNRQAVAYPFDRLRADPPADGRRNKVLWQVPGADSGNPEPVGTLTRPDGADTGPVRIELTPTLGGGKAAVYSSTVEVPQAGCWRFEMSWDAGQATIHLPFS